MYKRFGWDDEVPDQFNGLELNRVFKRGVEVHPMDNLNVATAMTAAGTYDWKRDGRPPMVPEKLFMAVENFQRQQGLKVDGIMNPGGPTQTRLNEVLPARMERPFIMSKRLPPREPDDPSRGKTWEQVWRERREAGLPAIISIDPHSEGYIGREPIQRPAAQTAKPTAAQPSPIPALGSAPPTDARNRTLARQYQAVADLDQSRNQPDAARPANADRPLSEFRQISDSADAEARRAAGLPPAQDPRLLDVNEHQLIEDALVAAGYSRSQAVFRAMRHRFGTIDVDQEPSARHDIEAIRNHIAEQFQEGRINFGVAFALMARFTGHHIVPISVINRIPNLSPAARVALLRATTGNPVTALHTGFNQPHRAYNPAVEQYVSEYMQQNRVSGPRMSGRDVYRIVEGILRHPTPDIGGYVRGVIGSDHHARTGRILANLRNYLRLGGGSR